MKLSLLIAALILPPAVADAQSSRLYDNQGRYQGRVEERGSQRRHYNEQGRYIGREQWDTRGVRSYDSKGRYLGRIDRPAQGYRFGPRRGT